MARIVCLANSKKYGQRCIAGKDEINGNWVRPITNRADGAVDWNIRQVDGSEPRILDILEIPIAQTGPEEGFQPENRTVKSGAWKKVGELEPSDLLQRCDDDSVVLLNDCEYIPYIHFSRMPRRLWKSLQLVHTKKALFYKDTLRNKPTWRTSFRYRNGTRCLDLILTDMSLLKRLEEGESIQRDCILTISLGMPWTPNKITEKRCYKIVAGVVEP